MNDTSMKPILCVVTSHPIRGDSGEPTGFAMVELTHPLQVFEAAGIPVDIASIRGGHPPIDFFDLSDPVNDRYWKDRGFRDALAHSLVLGDIDPSRYSAVFFAGGHGTMWDFADSPAVQKATREIWEAGGVVSDCFGSFDQQDFSRPQTKGIIAARNEAEYNDFAAKIVPVYTAAERR